MYSSERNPGINWKDIITKLIFLILFVLLLVWLFPKVPNMTTFYSSVFRDNLTYMQNAAKNYYTNERLPKKVGDTSEMTLRDMIDKSLLLPFVDKDGNACDTELSYVQVTKKDTEYILKVNLVCQDESNYIIETLGCHDYCDDCKVEEQEEIIEEKKEEKKEVKPVVKTVTEYEYKQAITSSNVSYSCPAGYELNNKTCYKSGSTRIAATAVYSGGGKVEVDALMTPIVTNKEYYSGGNISTAHNTYNYYCKTGSPYSGSGASLVCKVTAPKDYCASGRYDSNGKCKVDKGSAQANYTTKTSTKVSYVYDSCQASNTRKCTYIGLVTLTNCTNGCPRLAKQYKAEDTITEKVFTGYTCPQGGTPSNGKCYSYPDATCRPGYQSSNGKCYANGERSYTVSTSYTYSCPVGYKEEGSGASMRCYRTYVSGGTYYCENSSATLNAYSHKCISYTGSVISGYTCPEGYTKDGQYCYKSVTNQIAATAKTNTSTSYKYQWSTSTSLDGWIKTGNTRTKQI